MSQLPSATGAARTAIARQIGAEWGDMVLLGMLLASRADRAAADPLITLVNTEAPTGTAAPAGAADPAPGGAQPTSRRPRSAPSRPPTACRREQVAPLDGLAGESIVDWIGRL